MRTRVKFCGLRRHQDVEQAVRLGVDALGLVFCDSSKRSVPPELARELCHLMPAFVTPVGLFVNPDTAWVTRVLAQVRLGLLQFHGEETGDFCRSFGLPYIKAVRMRDGQSLLQAVAAHPHASGFLLDSYQAGAHGGTGQSFDWTMIPTVEQPLILAGGLRPDNVAAAITQVRPYAVDVSSGIESVPGCKEADRMRAFLDQVCFADHSNGCSRQ